MNTLDDLANAGAFNEFEYQLVYLRPSQYLDERIAVGLLTESSGRLDARFVATVAALDSMSRLIGAHGVEQFQFAISELRRSLARTETLGSLRIPTDLLVTGERQVAFTSDRGGLLASILSASCLMRSGPERRVDFASEAPPLEFSKDVINHVNRLNPLVGDRIFNQTITIESDQIELPIFGDRVFGAHVSFVGKDQSMRTESYIAKFRWLRSHLQQKPRVYLLRPGDHGCDLRLRKLHAIAEASDVSLTVSETTEEIATQILQDEAA
jgi:hypothetical protein